MKAISRWGGLLGAFGGLIWAALFLMDATPGFELWPRPQRMPFGYVLWDHLRVQPGSERSNVRTA